MHDLGHFFLVWICTVQIHRSLITAGKDLDDVSDLIGCVKGLEKNAYAGLFYHPVLAFVSLIAILTPVLIPLSLALSGHVFWMTVYLVFLFLTGLTLPESCGIPRWVGLFFPLASMALFYIFCRSVILAEWRQGIEWRDTRYPLQDLRKEHWRFLEEEAPM